MTEHPPPAPGWILGDDGHWKPPPFDLGGTGARPAAPAAPTGPTPPPPTSGPPSGWSIPPGGPPPGGAMPGQPSWPAPPAGPPAWGPPPAAPGSSTGRTVAMVLGIVAVVGVAGVSLLIGAVTFLGTAAERSEPRFTPVGSLPASTAADSGDDGGSGPSGASTSAPRVVSASEATATAAATDLVAGDWVVTDGEDMSAVVVPPEACVVDGWLSEDTDRFRVAFGRPSNGSTDALDLSVTTYTSPEAAQAELERAGSQTYRDCEVPERLDETTGGATGATVTGLPDDPLAPGVAYQIDLVGGVGGDTLTEYEFTIVVGDQRAHLDFCGCADLGLEGQQAVARQVAAVMAEVQGLPVPG